MIENITEIDWASVTAIAGFMVATWLGCYLATHTTRSRITWLAAPTVLSLAGYFLHAVLCLHIPAVQAAFLWHRFLGWFAIPPLPLWFHLTSELLPAHLAQRQRWLVLATYGTAVVLASLWLFGWWTFSSTSLVPLQLGLPVGLFGAMTSLACLGNLWYSQSRAREPALRRRQRLLWMATLLGAAGSIYWPMLASGLSLPWTPSLTLALGEAVLVLGLLVLAYAVARHNVFMAGRWILRDFVYHIFSIAAVVGLYAGAILGAASLAFALNFDALTLILVVVAGLVMVTHLLDDWARGVWDAVFFRKLRPLRVEMRTLTQEMARPVQPEQQMQHVVESLAYLTGSTLVCLALDEAQRLVIRAATDKERIGQTVNLKEATLSEGFVLMEPIQAFDRQVGYLLLGEKGVGEGYGRQERMWIAALAAHLSALLEQTRLREEATQQLEAIAQEVKEIESQEVALHQEMQRVLTGGPTPIDHHELCEALRYYGHPERLADLINREGSTLAALPAVAQSGPWRVQALQQILATAVDSLHPREALPSLEALRDRPMRKKRHRHLPSTVADFYTLRLIMAGYTHEAVAEELDVSPRQAQNYLERAATRLLGVLEADGRQSS